MVEPGRWQIVPSGPLATYFTTLVAGPYASVYDEHDGIRLGLHVRATCAIGCMAEAADILRSPSSASTTTTSGSGLDIRSVSTTRPSCRTSTPARWRIPGCVTFRDRFIYRGRRRRRPIGARRAGVIAHEMAHQWFGDLVTMRWWDDLWLNESFAEYLAHRCCSEATDYPLWTEFGIVRKDWGAIADQAPSTHPVAGNGADDAATALQDFDGISYAKGAAVLKQLAAYLGEEVFLSGLRSYFQRYALRQRLPRRPDRTWSAEGATDSTTGCGPGCRPPGWTPSTSAACQPEVSVTKIAATAEARRSHAITVGAIDGAGVITASADVILDDAPIRLSVPADTALVVPDLRDATWAKIRFGPQDWSGVAAVLPTLADETASGGDLQRHPRRRPGCRDSRRPLPSR